MRRSRAACRTTPTAAGTRWASTARTTRRSPACSCRPSRRWWIASLRRATEVPEAQRDVDLQGPRRVAPVAQQGLGGGQPLPHRVDVDAETIGGRLGVLVAVEISEQRGNELRTALAVVRDHRADRRFEESRKARAVVRLEQRRIQGQLVLRAGGSLAA